MEERECVCVGERDSVSGRERECEWERECVSGRERV